MSNTSRQMALAATLQILADRILSDGAAGNEQIGRAERLEKLAAQIMVAAAKSPAPRPALSLP